MIRYLILNDLSFRSPADHVISARARMEELIGTIMAAEDAGIDLGLRVHSAFYSEQLSHNYTISSWCADASVDLEIRRFFLSLATHAPLLENINDPQIEQSFYQTEFEFEGNKADGLGLAFLMSCIAISLNCHEKWDHNQLTLKMKLIDEQGSISENEIIVYHVSRPQHIAQCRAWINEMLQASILDGADLLSRREHLLSSLIFCGNTEIDLKQIPPGNPLFNQVVRRLFELQDYCRNWSSGGFNRSLMASKTNPESTATLQQYEHEHKFSCPDGESYIFSWHVYLTPSCWRIYFNPRPTTRDMLIGHIGRKLPCVTYGHV